MKFYLIDDDQNIINILKLIIQNRNLGEICGTSLNAEDAMEDLKYVQPDIVIVDLLMPVMDGITFVKQASVDSQLRKFGLDKASIVSEVNHAEENPA